MGISSHRSRSTSVWAAAASVLAALMLFVPVAPAVAAPGDLTVAK